MYSTFDAIKSFIDSDPTKATEARPDEVTTPHDRSVPDQAGGKMKLGLSYQINIVLPETENIAVFNAIFKSLRDNLLR
ncbi:MAG: hypothetical protein H0T56_10525 [Pseudaminobacter sp.]|nr:hypothetical protein [Pseudaminobacter sp.]